MPVQPDPTHPKFLEGDEVLRPPMVQDDDVEGHLDTSAVPEGDEPDGTAAEDTDEVEGT